jgi:hypothetical protein
MTKQHGKLLLEAIDALVYDHAGCCMYCFKYNQQHTPGCKAATVLAKAGPAITAAKGLK